MVQPPIGFFFVAVSRGLSEELLGDRGSENTTQNCRKFQNFLIADTEDVENFQLTVERLYRRVEKSVILFPLVLPADTLLPFLILLCNTKLIFTKF